MTPSPIPRFLDPDPRHVPGIEYDEPPRHVSAGFVIGVILVALVVGWIVWRLRYG